MIDTVNMSSGSASRGDVWVPHHSALKGASSAKTLARTHSRVTNPHAHATNPNPNPNPNTSTNPQPHPTTLSVPLASDMIPAGSTWTAARNIILAGLGFAAVVLTTTTTLSSHLCVRVCVLEQTAWYCSAMAVLAHHP